MTAADWRRLYELAAQSVTLEDFAIAIGHEADASAEREARIPAAARPQPGDIMFSAAPPTEEHPAPWRWTENTSALLDANEHLVVFSNPLARELIRLAPEMEQVLRAIEWKGDSYTGGGDDPPRCPECAKTETERHADGCALAAILAKLDAARKAT